MKRDMDRFGMYALLAAGLLALSSCATRARVQRRRPAQFNTGAARQLSLVQLTGRQDLRDLLRAALRAAASGSGWWSFQDACNERIALFPGAGADRAVAGRKPKDGEIFVRLDAYDAQVFRKKDGDASGNDGPPQEGEGKVRVRFAATVVGPERRALMRERAYAGEAAGDIGSKARRARLIRKAAGAGAEAFLADITPRRVRESIRLDEEASDMRPVAELVAKGEYAIAAGRLEAMRAREPRRADVVYNLAVLTDARGEYAAALRLYDQAMKLGHKSFYADSRDACEERLRDRGALGE